MNEKFRLIKTKKNVEILYLNHQSPIVNSTVIIRTRADNDKGLPHTLEHLIFMGSSQYPYKGTLDQLANLTMATGTNAWTATDHTAYTASNASVQGCIQLMGVYMNHLLHPLLTASAFTTEVFHYNSAGESMGVVVSEMQARQNSMEDLVQLQLHRALYRQSPFMYETGGFVKELRLLQVEECRRFHRAHYHPDNMLVVVCGQLTDQQLQQLAQSVDSGIEQDQSIGQSVQNPFHDVKVPAMEQSEVLHLEFPSADETVGGVTVGWRLGQLVTDMPDLSHGCLMTAVDVLFEYLIESSLAVLDKLFVQGEKQLCSSIDYSMLEYAEYGLELQFSGVEVEHLDEILSQLLQTLGVHEVQLKRIRDLLTRRLLSLQQVMETDPESYLVHRVIPLFLYRSEKPYHEAFSEPEDISRLLVADQVFWKRLLQYFVDAFYVAVVALPSKQLADELAASEREHASQFVNSHTREQLSALDERVRKSKLDNDVSIPDVVFLKPEIFNCSIDSNSLIRPQGHVYNKSGLIGKMAPRPFDESSCLLNDTVLQINDVNSDFVSLVFTVDTSVLTELERKHLTLLMDVFFKLPLKHYGDEPFDWTSDQVVAQLEKDTISYDISLGFNGNDFSCGSYGEYLVVELDMHRSKQDQGIQWLDWLLNDTVFDPEKLRISAGKLSGDLLDMERQGSVMLGSLTNCTLYQKQCNLRAITVGEQKPFLKQVVDSDNFVSIANVLSVIRQKLVKQNPRIQVIGKYADPSQVRTVAEKMSQFYIHNKISDMNPIVSAKNQLLPLSQCQGTINILPMKGIEGSYASFVIKGLTTYDVDTPALMLLAEYLSTMEGPLWKGVRGTGLAYGTSMSLKQEAGLLHLSIYRSPDAQLAHAAIISIVEAVKLDDQIALKAAKSSLSYSLVSQQDNIQSAASQSFVDAVFKKMPGIDQLLAKINAVSSHDLASVLNKYIINFADAKSSAGFVTTMPSLISKMKEQWTDAGYKVIIHEQMEVTTDDEDDDEAAGSEDDKQ